MSDLIRREDAIDYFVTNIGVVDADGYAVDDYDERVKIWTERFSGIPSAEPERKTGKWVDYDVEDINDYPIEAWQSCRCTSCGKWHTTPYKYNLDQYPFCPNCGAKMTRGEDGKA